MCGGGGEGRGEGGSKGCHGRFKWFSEDCQVVVRWLSGGCQRVAICVSRTTFGPLYNASQTTLK